MLKRNIPGFAVIRLPAIALQALFEPSEANAAVCEAREARNARGEAREREINQSINQSLFKHGKIHQEFKN